MTSAVVSLKPGLSEETISPAARTYQTKTSFVAVHFDQAGEGRIAFLPKGALIRVVGTSCCLREGLEVMFENHSDNIFEIDLMAWSTIICEQIRTKRRAMSACA
jgi:hypothetical protein